MKTVTHYLAIILLLIVTVSPALACSLEAWEGVSVGATVGDPSNNIARVGGQCALKVTGTGQVTDNSPDGETEFIGRFYFYPKMLSQGNHEIFAVLADQTNINSRLFVISYDGSNINLDASPAGGGQVSVGADPTHWNLVEFAWNSGTQGQLWVNADALSSPPSGTFASGAGSVDQVRLGAVSDIGADTAFFDDYVSRRSPAVGPLLVGDGNADGEVDSEDIDVIVNEYLFDDFGNGVVDCNLDGSVNSGDVNCVVADT